MTRSAGDFPVAVRTDQLRTCALVIAVPFLLFFQAAAAFSDSFDDKIGEGWSWVREVRDTWRIERGSLRIRPQKGTLWGNENGAPNLLLRPLPMSDGPLAVEVTIADASEQGTTPTLYEQAGLLWYACDDNYVKLVREWYDGRWHVVLGREAEGKAEYTENDCSDKPLRLRLVIDNGVVRGSFRATDWEAAGEFNLPEAKEPRVGLTAVTGADPIAGRVAVFDDFSIAPTAAAGDRGE